MCFPGKGFLRARDGSLAPVFAMALLPMVAVVGFSMDYTSAVSTRASMQNALDAAVLAVTTLPPTATDTDRLQKLRDSFVANGGQGTGDQQRQEDRAENRSAHGGKTRREGEAMRPGRLRSGGSRQPAAARAENPRTLPRSDDGKRARKDTYMHVCL